MTAGSVNRVIDEDSRAMLSRDLPWRDMAGCKFRMSGELINTDIVMNQTFWLATFPALGEPQLDYIADKLEEFFGLTF